MKAFLEIKFWSYGKNIGAKKSCILAAFLFKGLEPMT